MILVEGASDAAALETLARRRGHRRSGVRIVALGGYTNVPAALGRLPEAAAAAVLCDAGAERYVRRVLRPGDTCRVCDRDLEDELIRAIGAEAVLRIVAAQGESGALASLANQPAHRHRSTVEHLHRFLGTRSGRKERYGALLADAVELGALPAPLAAVLDDAGL